MVVVISHTQAPVEYTLKDRSVDDEANASVIYCQISSNSFFYSTFLGQLSSSSPLADLFYQYLARSISQSAPLTGPNRLQPIFSKIHRQNNTLYLKVSSHIKPFDEWINRLW